MPHRIKLPSFNRRRDHADQIETAEATAYFADVKADLDAHRDEPLGADVGEPDAEPWTADDYPWPVAPDAETQQIPAVPPLADWERDLLADPPEQRDVQPWECHDPDDAPTEQITVIPPAPAPEMRRRPTVHTDAPGWTEEDVRAMTAKLAAAIEERAAEEPPAELPEPRRRHLPAVGAWFADRLRPVPLPAIPDADHMAVVPITPEPTPWTVQAQESGRLALEAAASTHHFPDERQDDEHPDDFVEWLRAEFAGTYALCEAAHAEHAATAQSDLAHFGAHYFQGAQHAFDQLNAMTLPGWTGLETALYTTGVFA